MVLFSFFVGGGGVSYVIVFSGGAGKKEGFYSFFGILREVLERS